MNTLPYLSPTSIKKFFDDREEFYLTYLAEQRPPREPQQAPAGVGSAFDAFVKAELFGLIYGKNHPDAEKYDRDALLTQQVTTADRDAAIEAGGYVFLKYRQCGALADLMYEMDHATTDPRFEYKVQREINGVPLLGMPDLYFVHKNFPVVYDWKVNGYYSQASPCKGYVQVYECNKGSRRGPHKITQPGKVGPFDGNLLPIEEYNPDWARQLCIYAWCEGAEVGDDIIAGIDQIVGRKSDHKFPNLRVARFRSHISKDFQKKLDIQIQYIWECIKSGWIFRDKTFDQSLEKQAELEIRASKLATCDDTMRRIARSEGQAKW